MFLAILYMSILLLSATFVALRSIFLIKLYGKKKLPGSFGLLIMFQGFAVLAGSFISGEYRIFFCYKVQVYYSKITACI